MIGIECEINLNLFGSDQDEYETNGKQEIDDIWYFHNEIFKVEE